MISTATTARSQNSPVEPFRVWIRPTGRSWKLRVEGRRQATWLVDQLVQHDYDCSELVASSDNKHFKFTCLTTTTSDRDAVERLLVGWPEVQIQLSPEQTVRENSPSFREQAAAPLDESIQKQPIPVSKFRVWVRPMGLAWRLRAEGIAGATWLYNELLHRGFECSEPGDLSATGQFVFNCLAQTRQQKDYVWNLLQGLPQVNVQNSPA